MNSRLKNILKGIFMCLFFASNAGAQDSTTVSKFKLSYENGFATLKLDYVLYTEGAAVIDTSKKVRTNKSRASGDWIQRTLYDLVAANPNLDKNLYPYYVEDIVALMKGEKKKAKAREIYEKANGPLVGKSESSSFSKINGVTKGSDKLTYSFQFKVKENTSLVIPQFIFRTAKSTYYTKEMIVEIQKPN